ncbi:NAD(P)-dependent dehydrogenase (short-subunit alcohol dehydrogenase family) [Rhizobium sp. SG_E_25_P2]|uniref:SDR family oxidoreductase n=1 Tax=Rhizobium sp. SG_E_25_P2 TaxID=2879942 RepID=UPI00247305AC|nr:SDR family oxidoreductase [Rhizobium sp. SG_E_25_P2]MDH6268916.1 NAD(P)-dependent dehydrogenase (short-subunit alcohol dehydrogenase family) [Rhizobium sp. SG_E_25_P2]
MGVLDNKVAIISGASSGIGKAAAHLFAEEGASVILNARGQEALERVAAEIRAGGGKAIAIAGDVGLAETHAELAEEAENRFGGLDIAFNNAGMVGAIKPLAELSVEDWQAALTANLTAAFLASRAQIPAMLARGGGAIVFTSSFVGTSVGLPGMGAYAAAKAGLMGLVKSIAADYGAKNIRANALLPGGTDTGMAGDQAQKDWAASLHAMKRIAEPDEIARAALFLASPAASFVTGAALYADGGNSAVK